MGGLDVAQHPAGTDGCQLLVVTDETDRAAPIDHEVDDIVITRSNDRTLRVTATDWVTVSYTHLTLPTKRIV